MTKNRKRTPHARTIVYYVSIIISLGLIWGGGMSLLRGATIDGLIAIVLGILLQVGLKWSGIGERENRPKTSERDAVLQEHVYEISEMDATPKTDDLEETPEQVQNAVFRRKAAGGTDGATLLLDSNSKLDLPHKLEKGKTDET